MYNDAPQPKAWTLNIAPDTAFDGSNLVKFSSRTERPAIAQAIIIENISGQAVQIRFNGDPDCTFSLASGGGYSFGRHEMQISSVDFANTASGGTATVQIIAGVSNG